MAAVAVPVLCAVVFVRTQLIDIARVSSDSMAPTVCTGDTVLTARLDAGDAIHDNDIVTFKSPQNGEEVIKRVVGVAGQKVAIEDALLIVDGVPVDEPYVDHATIDGVYFGTVTVPEGTVFVMGDHRETSIDSRAFGPVPIGSIDGRLLSVLWSNC